MSVLLHLEDRIRGSELQVHPHHCLHCEFEVSWCKTTVISANFLHLFSHTQRVRMQLTVWVGRSFVFYLDNYSQDVLNCDTSDYPFNLIVTYLSYCLHMVWPVFHTWTNWSTALQGIPIIFLINVLYISCWHYVSFYVFFYLRALKVFNKNNLISNNKDGHMRFQGFLIVLYLKALWNIIFPNNPSK